MEGSSLKIETCDTCGYKLQPDENFCGNCGVPIKTFVNGGPTFASPPSRTPAKSSAQNNIPLTEYVQQRNHPTQESPLIASKSISSNVAKKKRWIFLRAAVWIINSRGFWPTIITIAIVLFVGLAGYGMISLLTYNTSPEYELQKYCGYLEGMPDYDLAYTELSSKETGKSSLTKDQFIARVKAIADPRDGIGDCTIHIVSQFGEIAHGTITYTYGNGSTLTERYEVFQDSYNTWKIETQGWQPTTAPAA
jgi:hypothetical protein